MALVTDVSFSQTNPTGTSARNSPSLATELTNINTELGAIENSLHAGYYRDSNTVAYVSTGSFTVLSDRHLVYTAGRQLRFNGDGTPFFGTVTSSTYNGGTNLTTVLIQETTVPTPLTTVDLALQPFGNMNPTLYNKTLVSPTVTNPTVTNPTTTGGTFVKPILNGVQVITTDTYSATPTIDMSTSNVHVMTLTGNATLTVSNVSVGQYFSLEFIQDATGGRTMTWFSGITWVDSTVPTLTATASKKDVFVFRCTGTNTYNGYIAGQNIG